MHTKHQDRHHYGADDNAAVYRFTVLYKRCSAAASGGPITPKHTNTQNEVINVGDKMSQRPAARPV
jgi:hypothetical protein